MKKPPFRSLEMVAKKLTVGFGAGAHQSPLKDSIVDVDVVREYQPGDRKLDSRSSLRTNQTMSRVFNPDKCQTLFVALDESPSQYTKIVQSVTTGLYLNYLAEITNDFVSLVAFNEKVTDFVSPTQDHRTISCALDQYYHRELKGFTDLELALKSIASLDPSNSVVFLVSDFCYDISDRAMTYLRRFSSGVNNTVVALIMVNPDEWRFSNMPFSIDLADAESSERATWDFNARGNQAYSKAFQEWQTSLNMRLRQAGVEPLLINVGRSDFLIPLVKYLLRT